MYKTAIKKNMQVMGIRRGYNGLINGDISEMNIRSVSNVLHRGGTMLLTARCNEFKTEEGQMQAVGVCKELGIDGLVIIGGDGSFMGARALSLKGIPCIGIPGTIDNDIACTDYTIGFDTALTQRWKPSTVCAIPPSPTTAARWSRSWVMAQVIWRCTQA